MSSAHLRHDGAHGVASVMEATNLAAERPVQDFDVESFLRESIDAIWEHKMLGRIVDLYAPHAQVHSGMGASLHGGQQVLDRAVQWLAAFPDLRLFVDDIVCARRAEAYLAAVRWTAVGRNTGPSAYGAATGRRVVISGIATSRIEGARIVEQWIELGDGDLARQLGFDEATALQRLWPQETASDLDTNLDHGAAERPTGSVGGDQPPQDSGADAAALVRAAVDAIWNRRQIGEVARFYAPHYREWGPGARALFGRDELQADIIALMGAFPDLQMHVDDVFWDDDQRKGCRSSTRWTLLGANTGPSAHGPPTGASLRLSGITTSRIEAGQFVAGWTAYSELSLARRLVRSAPRAQIEDSE